MSESSITPGITVDLSREAAIDNDEEELFRQYGITEIDRRVHALKIREAEARVDAILSGRR